VTLASNEKTYEFLLQQLERSQLRVELLGTADRISVFDFDDTRVQLLQITN